jgi:4-hydroxybenzoate polyprenyltransferase
MKMKKYINFAYKEFIFGGHVMSISAVVGGLIYKLYTNQNLDFAIPLLIYVTIQPIYILDRLLDFEKDKEDNPERSVHLEQNKRKYQFILLAYLIGFAVLNLYISSVEIALVSTFYLVFGMLYTKVFKQLTKYIPFFKNIYVAAFFFLTTITIGTYPESHIEVNSGLLITATYILLMSLDIQMIFDLKDIKSDGKSGLKTFPVLFGVKNTLSTALVLSIIRSGLIALSVYSELIGQSYLALILITFFEIALIIKLWKKINLQSMIGFAFLYILSFTVFFIIDF